MTNNYLKKLIFISVTFCFIFFSCNKNEIIHKPENLSLPLVVKAYKTAISESNDACASCSTHVFLGLNDGNYIMVNYDDNQDIRVTMKDKAGIVSWELLYGRPGNQVLNIGEVIPTSDGSIILTGGVDISDYNMDVFLLKIDKSGNIIWEKTYDIFEWETAYSVYQTIDGGYILAGATLNRNSNNMNEYLVLKTNENGELEWKKTYENTNKDDYAHCVIQTTDKNYLIVGRADAKGKIHKIDQDGTILWQKTLQEYYIGKSIIAANDGGYLLLADYFNQADSTQLISLIKIDESGNILWQKDHGQNVSAGIIRKLDGNGYYAIISEENAEKHELWYFNNSGEKVEQK